MVVIIFNSATLLGGFYTCMFSYYWAQVVCLGFVVWFC